MGVEEDVGVGGNNKAEDEESDDVEEAVDFQRHCFLVIRYAYVMRQNTCRVACGMDLSGFFASAAAKPVSSVPPKAKAAVTNTEQKPLKPFRKAPGSCQYLAPMYPPAKAQAVSIFATLRLVSGSYSRLSVGTPPQLMMIPRMMKPVHAMILIMLSTNST